MRARHDEIDHAAARLEALGNPTGLKIYRVLVRAGEAGSSVRRLQNGSRSLRLPSPTT
jgi:DNA-binding transcriptional ArsR family regulator